MAGRFQVSHTAHGLAQNSAFEPSLWSSGGTCRGNSKGFGAVLLRSRWGKVGAWTWVRTWRRVFGVLFRQSRCQSRRLRIYGSIKTFRPSLIALGCCVLQVRKGRHAMATVYAGCPKPELTWNYCPKWSHDCQLLRFRFWSATVDDCSEPVCLHFCRLTREPMVSGLLPETMWRSWNSFQPRPFLRT